MPDLQRRRTWHDVQMRRSSFDIQQSADDVSVLYVFITGPAEITIDRTIIISSEHTTIANSIVSFYNQII